MLEAETLVAGWGCAKKAMLPILVTGEPAHIRHNIAQTCQAASSNDVRKIILSYLEGRELECMQCMHWYIISLLMGRSPARGTPRGLSPLEQRPIRWNRARFHLIGHKLL